MPEIQSTPANATPGTADIAVDSSRRLNDRLFHRLPHVVFRADRNGILTDLTSNWRALSGYSVAAARNRGLIRFIHPEDRDRCRNLLDGVALDLRLARCETVRLITRSDRSRWIEIQARTIPSASGVAHDMLGTITDITSRIGEEALLLANHRTLNGMLNDLPGMVYRCRNDREWTMDYVSAGSDELTGYLQRDIINNNRRSYNSLIHQDDREAVWQEVQNALREQRHFELIYRIVTAASTIKRVWERGNGIFSEDGELLGLEGLIIDVSQQKRARLGIELNALFDPLTGAPTRTLFIDRLTRCIVRMRSYPTFAFSVFCLHLDRFERYCQHFGSDGIEQARREIHRRLAGICSPLASIQADHAHRYLLLEEAPDLPVEQTAQAIQECLLEPLVVNDYGFYITASIGAVRGLAAARDAGQLIDMATSAMNRAHELGGDRFETYRRQASGGRECSPLDG